MAFEKVRMAPLSDLFREWAHAQEAVDVSVAALEQLAKHRAATPSAKYRPLFDVQVETVCGNGQSARIGVGGVGTRVSFAFLAQRLADDFNKRSDVVLAQVLEELKAVAEEKRVAFLRGTMREISGDEPLASAAKASLSMPIPDEAKRFCGLLTYEAISDLPPSDASNKGDYYLLTTAGHAVNAHWRAGDWLMSDGEKWVHQPVGLVSSVGGAAGRVTFDDLAPESQSRLGVDGIG